MSRPFKGLPISQGPQSQYDAIIIGAGIGGLICANLLARENLKVLLVEQHYMVGGYCSTFRRKGYCFDAASHFYPLLGNESTLTGKLLKELSIQTQWIKMDPVDTFHFPDGSRFEVPADFQTYLQKVKESFPHQREELDAFFKHCRKAYINGLLHFFKGKSSQWMRQNQADTVRDVLDRFFQDRKLKLLLTADGPHWGSPPNDTSFVFDAMLRLSYFEGNYYPKGGSQVFSDALAARFESLGGHILMKSPVQRILTEAQRVIGVDISCGPRNRKKTYKVLAPFIISNADMHQTLNRMLPSDSVPQKTLNQVEALKPSFPCFLLHLGLKGLDHDYIERVQGYYWNEWDPDLMGRDGLRFKIFCPTLYDPSMAPPGGQILIIQKVLDLDYEGIEDWADHKQQIQNTMLDRLRLIFPDIDQKIVTMNAASAKTSHRFTQNFQGAMLGWTMSPQQLGERRPQIESPFENLYFTGHWTRPGGGITPVIVSAQIAAEKILKKHLKPQV